MRRYIFIIILMLMIGAASVVLPIAFIKWQDEKRLENMQTEAATEVVLDIQKDMTLIEKIKLITNEKARVVELVNGKNYNQSTIEWKLKEEIQRLNELGIIEIDIQGIRYGERWLNMYVDPADGAKSLLLWRACLVTEDYELILYMDDDTGKIIDIHQSYYDYSQSDYFRIESSQKKTAGEMAKIAEVWGQYLECSLIVYDSDIYNEVEDELGVYENIEGEYFAIYEDEGGHAGYLLRKGIYNIIFSAEIYK